MNVSRSQSFLIRVDVDLLERTADCFGEGICAKIENFFANRNRRNRQGLECPPTSCCRRTGSFTVALPFCDVTLSAKKPPEKAYPKTLETIGDHIRKRRLDLGLFQKEVAVTIGVDTCTVTNWERGHSEPELRLIPSIIGFLGYEPTSDLPATLGERIKQYRILKGISQKELARHGYRSHNFKPIGKGPG